MIQNDLANISSLKILYINLSDFSSKYFFCEFVHKPSDISNLNFRFIGPENNEIRQKNRECATFKFWKNLSKMPVHKVANDADFTEKLNQGGTKLIVVDFSAAW